MLALHMSTPETKEILGSPNTSLQWGFLPKHPVKFRKQSITALHTQHFCFHFHSASIELSPRWSMLDAQCSAVPQWSLLQDLQGSSSNWKQQNLCSCTGVYFTTYSCGLCWETKTWMSKYSKKGNAVFPSRSLAAQAPPEMIKGGFVCLILRLCHFQVCSTFPPADAPL